MVSLSNVTTFDGNNTLGVGVTVGVRLHGFFSDELTEKLYFVLLVVVCKVLSLFGIVANVINVVAFTKQGFKENITVSFTFLACFDLASLIALLWIVISMNPLVRYHPNLPFHSQQVGQLFGSQPRLFFSRLSTIVTVYISVERCVSVIKPLHVKTIFTRRTFVALIVCSTVLLLANAFPVFYGTRLTWKTDPLTNKTYLGTYFIKNRHLYNSIPNAIDSVMTFTFFFTIAFSAVILVGALRSRKPLLVDKDVESNKAGKFLSTKDKRAAQTVTYLAAMFIVCYFPSMSYRVFMASFKEFNRRGRYVNIYFVAWYMAYVMEAICASCNILVYLRTSTKYREALASALRGRFSVVSDKNVTT